MKIVYCKKTFLFLGATVVLSACSSGPIADRNPQLVASPDKVSGMLAEAADRASVALETLAAIEQSKSSDISAVPPPVENVPPELKRAVTVNWVGPVEQITKKMAERAGYQFMILGDQPPIPVVVSLDVENRPVLDVLRDLGLQMGRRANIRVDGSRRIVEIHYASIAGVSG